MLSIFSVGCAHEKSAQQGQFPVLQSTFEQYQIQSQAYLAERSMRHRSYDDIQLNLPFEILASDTAAYQGKFLLFHGLNDSPYVWRNYAHALSRKGFDVRAILFEGHGSTPEDMLDVRWQSWMHSARRHLKSWDNGDVPVFLGGFSMGGVIATWLALDNPSISGLFLVSPAYKSKLNHYLRWSGLYARFRPWVFGGMILEDNPIKYNSIPVNSGWQYYKLTRAMKRRWKWQDRISAPTLIVFSEDDSVVDHRYTRELFSKRFINKHSKLVRYSASVSAEAYNTLTGLVTREVRRPSAYRNLRILNQSHLGLMYSSDDPLFGKQGRVLVCNGNEYPVFIACMRATGHWFAAQHTPSPDGVPVARTTFNNDWQTLLDVFEQVFIKR